MADVLDRNLLRVRGSACAVKRTIDGLIQSVDMKHPDATAPYVLGKLRLIGHQLQDLDQQVNQDDMFFDHQILHPTDCSNDAQRWLNWQRSGVAIPELLSSIALPETQEQQQTLQQTSCLPQQQQQLRQIVKSHNAVCEHAMNMWKSQ